MFDSGKNVSITEYGPAGRDDRGPFSHLQNFVDKIKKIKIST